MNSIEKKENDATPDDLEKEWRGMVDARKRIEEAFHSGARELKLSNLGLMALPPEIGKLTGLVVLDISGNLFRTLPPEISQLTSLRELDVFDNRLTVLSPEIGKLVALEKLDIGGNPLTTLPLEISRLKSLRHLGVHRSGYMALPPEILRLTWLKELLFSRNRIKSVTPQIRQLSELTMLSFSESQLTELPQEIGELKALTKLYLYDNQLKSLPKALQHLPRLEELHLYGNSTLDIPDEVMGSKYGDVVDGKVKPQGILDYYFANRQRAEKYGTQPLNEAKVIVLGEAEVGKSSLILALTEKMLKQPLQKTDGIVQKRWQVPLRGGQLAVDGDDGDESFQVNLWDFGGQEIYKHTHTFFLTRRAVYLLVANARANERQNNLEYWLQMATSFGAAPHVWIAVNKCDEHNGGPDKYALMRKYPNIIRGFLRTSCWTGEGIDELKETLMREVLELEGVRRPINKVWLAIKRALETMKADVISTEDYRTLCQQHGENEADMPEKLLELWDTLGTVRYFPEQDDDPPEIRDSAILNPEWVTNAVYAVLDDKKVRDAGGLVTEEDFQRILKKAGYAPERSRMIEHVMRRFDLLVDTPDYKPQHKMLVPQLLSEREPRHVWPANGTLDFIYRYTVLPGGLIPSFIARSYQKLSKTPGPWRHGCVLDFPTGARVRIIGDAEKRQVTISVIGGKEPLDTRDALDAVRSIFDDMHTIVKGLVVEELIPVRGRADVPPISYRWLRGHEINGMTKAYPEGSTPGELIEIDVQSTLNYVRGKARTETEYRQTIIVYGDNPKPNIFMGTTNTQEITGGTFYGPVGVNQSIDNHNITTEAVSQNELFLLLKQLNDAAMEAAPQLDNDSREKLQNRVMSLTETSKKEKVDKEQLQFSAEGIIKAASIFPPIVSATKAILSLFNIHIP